jgi:hypothetical protein
MVTDLLSQLYWVSEDRSAVRSCTENVETDELFSEILRAWRQMSCSQPYLDRGDRSAVFSCFKLLAAISELCILSVAVTVLSH